MKPVFEYLDYRDVMKDAFEDRKKATPRFSYRTFAQMFQMDTGNLYRIVQGEAHLPARSHSRAIEFLDLSGDSAEYFLLLIAHARERKESTRTEILEKAMAVREVARRRLADRELSFYRDWRIGAVRAMVEVVGGRVDPAEIAARLRPMVLEDEVVRALDVLLSLGLVAKSDDGRFALSEAHLTAGGPGKTSAIRGFQKQVLTLASESIDRFPVEQRDVDATTFAVDSETFLEIQQILRRCRRQIQARVDLCERPDRVLQLAMALFPLSSVDASGGAERAPTTA